MTPGLLREARAAATEPLKRLAAERAAGLVEPGMLVGLGTGSTAALAVEAIGRRLREGSLAEIRGVATSSRTSEQARAAGIPLVELDGSAAIDVTIDGADEVEPRLDLVKGGGGALLREKIVARESRRNVIVVDETKLVERLGTTFPVAVEVARFGWRTHVPALEALGARVTLRPGAAGDPYVTDDGHYILDCRFEDGIDDPARLEGEILARPGVVETGLFLRLASMVIVGGRDGIRLMER